MDKYKLVYAFVKYSCSPVSVFCRFSGTPWYLCTWHLWHVHVTVTDGPMKLQFSGSSVYLKLNSADSTL